MELQVIKNKLDLIFDNYSNVSETAEIAKRGYLFSELIKKAVLFVGINPSFQEETQSIRDSFRFEDALIGYKKYFQPYEDLCSNTKIKDDFTYIDLLFLRETNQKVIDGKLSKHTQWVEFIAEQLRISQKRIEAIKRKLIVVCNAGAGKFLGAEKIGNSDEADNVWMGYNFEFDRVFGVNVISGVHNNSIMTGEKETTLYGTPVIFTGYLKYLSSSTKKTLGWQIDNVLENCSNYFGDRYSLENEAVAKKKIMAIFHNRYLKKHPSSR
ncbi:hypothetical protein SDC9_49618 [bioreactor metagenome]|uniref:Uncharacterized protein n=1 Tax=bioreactor metagenome TaxID=1076179 RepID=A0A644WLQ9_9ZZZZ